MEENGEPSDRLATALAMAICALCVGHAIDIRRGFYSPSALAWLSIGGLVCVVAVTLPRIAEVELLCGRLLRPTLAAAAALQAAIVVRGTWPAPSIAGLTALIAVLGLAQIFDLRALRVPLITLMLVAFCLAGTLAFRLYSPDPNIDVFRFQQGGAQALLRGANPYTVKIANPFGPGTPVYGPGIVDRNDRLTVGPPYPPLSLLMVLPAYGWGGDCRYAHVAAVAISAALMTAARPGLPGALAAVLFLLTPQVFYVINTSWTEPLLTLTFSLVMFCACRWRPGLPWVLGLFFATKQYGVLAVPLLGLLLVERDRSSRLLPSLAKAGAVVAALNVPFLLWNPGEFFRAVVEFQFMQPFRHDALSYLVWVYYNYGGYEPPMWALLLTLSVAVGAALAMALRGCARTPAGFAAAMTLVGLAFFAFNKQAFCNYYYFVIATACWAVAAIRMPEVTYSRAEGVT